MAARQRRAPPDEAVVRPEVEGTQGREDHASQQQSAVLAGAATVFFAVFGYDAMSTAAEESGWARRFRRTSSEPVFTVT